MTCLPLLLYLPKQCPKILLADWKSRYIAKLKHGDHQPKNPKTTPYLTDKSFVSHITYRNQRNFQLYFQNPHM